MAVNNSRDINIPNDIVKICELKFTADPLYNFLVNMVERVAELEAQVTILQERVTELENGS